MRGVYVPEVPFTSNEPRGYGESECGQWRFVVMERMAGSIESFSSKKQTMKVTLAEVGVQMLECLEALHELQYVYIDVKPDNFMLANMSNSICSNKAKNKQNKQRIVRLIDFGLIERYTNLSSKGHRDDENSGAVVGTPLFGSLNMLRGHTPSRRDDIEALGYVLMHLILHSTNQILPWADGKSDADILKKKEEAVCCSNTKGRKAKKGKGSSGGGSVYALLGSDGPVIKTFMEMVMGLGYKVKPDYDALKDILRRLKGSNSKNSGAAKGKGKRAALACNLSSDSESDMEVSISSSATEKSNKKQKASKDDETPTRTSRARARTRKTTTAAVAAKKETSKPVLGPKSKKAPKASSSVTNLKGMTWEEKAKAVADAKRVAMADRKRRKDDKLLHQKEQEAEEEDPEVEDVEESEGEVVEVIGNKFGRRRNKADDLKAAVGPASTGTRGNASKKTKAASNKILSKSNTRSSRSSARGNKKAVVVDDSEDDNSTHSRGDARPYTAMDWEPMPSSSDEDGNCSSGEDTIVNNDRYNRKVGNNRKENMAPPTPVIKIRFVEGPYKGEIYLLPSPSVLIIGRAEDKLRKQQSKQHQQEGHESHEISIKALPNDVEISSIHTMFEVKPISNKKAAHYSVCVTDLNSSNGTFVNGKELTGSNKLRKVFTGDKVNFGKSTCVIEKVATK
eukprot:CAMPEP_0194396332 /NCGR_PEP_ID=MMETSP0174-20130528/124928_1 /TAXON_ID=216777 /ORGANISM="Proboscia alata, Strain PI-D3" /LENGTH=679 /DNA_ID=CAMNT_0039192381 /DNA_START=100 /DNA_END=2139 /DNA_ORIENTATION=-